MKKIYSSLGILAFIAMMSCESENAEELYPVSVDDCPTDNITYDNTIKLIVDNNCAVSGCHVSNNNLPVLENYTQVKSIVDDGGLRQRVLVDKDMPPNGSLSTCNLNKIEAWLDSGAPEN